MPPYKTEAINLKTSPFGEADKILTLFTREYGKIKAIAKGARRPGSKFGGRLEILAHNQFLLASGRDLDVVTQCETINSFYDIRKNQDKLASSIYLIKLVDGSTVEGQKNSRLFDILLYSLKLLEEGTIPKVLTKIFEIKLIDVEGFFPVLDRCVKCSKGIKVAPKKVKFNLTLKGILCSGCSKKILGGIEIPYFDILLMLKIKGTLFPELKDLVIDEKTLERLDLVLSPYISDHIGRDIRLWK